MYKAFFAILLFWLLLFNSCSSFNQLAYEAETAYSEGRNEEALELYDQLIEGHNNRNRQVDPEIYQKAGVLAYQLGETSKAIKYLGAARQKVELNAESLVALAGSYRNIDNLTLEIRNLEAFVNSYPDHPEYTNMQHRYFEALAEGMNWDEAYALWPELQGEPYQDESLLKNYLKVTAALEKDDKSIEIARKLLAVNENNIAALDWLARKYYYQAVERYDSEMKAYERNRTHRQYAQLRQAWPVIHADYRTSRDYFLRLYAIDAKSEYARFLANIYERLNDDVKARYYRQRAN